MPSSQSDTVTQMYCTLQQRMFRRTEALKNISRHLHFFGLGTRTEHKSPFVDRYTTFNSSLDVLPSYFCICILPFGALLHISLQLSFLSLPPWFLIHYCRNDGSVRWSLIIRNSHQGYRGL